MTQQGLSRRGSCSRGVGFSVGGRERGERGRGREKKGEGKEKEEKIG